MLEYQQRVVTEKKELDARISRLAKFIGSSAFDTAPAKERGLLVDQFIAMWGLSMVIGARIDGWPEDSSKSRFALRVIPVNMEQVLAIERGEEPFPEEVGLNLAYGRAVA